MPQFVDHRSPNLVADFSLAGADRLDVLLVKHDVVRPRPQIEKALLCCWHTMKQTQKEPSSPREGRRLVRWQVLYENGNIVNACAKLSGSESKTSSTTLVKCSRSMFHLFPTILAFVP